MKTTVSSPTVASLCSALGAHLTPAASFRAPDIEVTAVHLSDLPDPTSYLFGGELLLTTGMTLPMDESGCRAYAARLKGAEISALALGLGPVHHEPPEALVVACRQVGLDLLTVPAPTPFQNISRAYWDARNRKAERALSDVVAAHRALIDAAVAADPTAAILRRLTQSIDGWAVLLDASGDVEQAYPMVADEFVEELRSGVARLEVAGVHSSASFALGEHVVAVFPLAVEDRIVGYLAAGIRDQVDGHRRQIMVTATALLSITMRLRQGSESARHATRRCVATLVDEGFIDAARSLAVAAGQPPPSREMHVLALQGRDSGELARVVEKRCPNALAVTISPTHAWFLVPPERLDRAAIRRDLRTADSSASAVLSELGSADEVGFLRARTMLALGALAPGVVEFPHPLNNSDVRAAVDRLADRTGTEMLESVVAYLRCRGQWERAASSLSVHRNTLRYRVERAREVVGLDLDDPDVAAETWLELRRRRLA
jgi:PucR family transcriptional regulator, purine catabolism regulatory protein